MNPRLLSEIFKQNFQFRFQRRFWGKAQDSITPKGQRRHDTNHAMIKIVERLIAIDSEGFLKSLLKIWECFWEWSMANPKPICQYWKVSNPVQLIQSPRTGYRTN